ncbi:hypothetical protein QBC38DRAFT_492123 [Podospora fimiseda]|uniref:C2H2-type domain-containing protein n=1 Tax=Podospora fimiseda TaxID=252190 RepID=A0AAN6YLD7_9PEZI|nr:hypothetical protein QBC38DRAFT_492123 [Podospora fimiseda]
MNQTPTGLSGASTVVASDTPDDPGEEFKRFLKAFKSEAQLSKKTVQNFEGTTAEDVKLVVAEIQDRQISSNQQRYLGRLKPFLASLQQYGKVIEVFVNVNEVLAFVWGPMKFMLQTACNLSEALNLLLEAYFELGELMPQLEAYQDYCRNNEHMRTVLALIYKDILDFHRVAMRHFRKSTWKKMFSALWKGFVVKLEELKDNMRRHRQLIVEQGSIVRFQELQQLRVLAETKFQDIQDEYVRRRWTDAQRWLTPYNSHLQQEICAAARNECPGSGQWLLNDNRFKKWFDPLFCSTPLLWLNGIPGAGKTVLASTVVETVQKITSNQIRLAYFYCRHGDESRNTFVAVAKGLLSQLLKGNSDLALLIYEKGNLESGEAILLDRTMTKALLQIALVEPQKTTYIIIDGIDECSRDERKEICSWFCTSVHGIPKEDFGALRCLFVSQEDGAAKKDLGMIPSIKMQASNTRDDIKRYVECWQKKIESKHGVLDTKKHPLVNSIMSSAQGMFLFAKLAVEYLHALPTTEQLIENIEPGMFPDGIGKLYERILDRIFADEPVAQAKRNTASRLLGILAVAKRPLRWHEIQGLFAFDPDDEDSPIDRNARMIREDPKDLCWSLVERHQDDSVELVHPTAKEYLVRTGHLQLSATEFQLAESCLLYLSIPGCTTEIERKTVLSHLLGGSYAFVDYAVACWSLHVQKALPGIDSTEKKTILAEGISTFLEAHWRESATMTMTVSTQMNDKLKAMEGFEFYPKFVQAIISARKQLGPHGKGPSEEEPLGLSDVVDAIRDCQKGISPTDELKAVYGKTWFKCPRVNCVRFYDGYATAGEWKHHVDRHERPFNCGDPSCAYFTFGYSSEKDLQKHLFERHGLDPGSNVHFPAPATETAKKSVKEGGFRCPECPASFTRKFALNNHIRAHRNERPFRCGTCQKGFVRQNDCKRHEAIHSGKKTFVCSGTLKDGTPWGCKSAFLRQDKLRDHFRSDTGRRCIGPVQAELEKGPELDVVPSTENAGTAAALPAVETTATSEVAAEPSASSIADLPSMTVSDEPDFDDPMWEEFLNSLISWDADSLP